MLLSRFRAVKVWETFLKAFGDSSVSGATLFRWHSQFVAGKELIEDAEWSGRLGTMKMNKNIARVGAVLKDDNRAGCRMINRKPSFTAFCLMI